MGFLERAHRVPLLENNEGNFLKKKNKTENKRDKKNTYTKARIYNKKNQKNNKT